jgi:hypothetical protein
MNPKTLNVYTVIFDDGTIERVYGLWAAHGHFIAQQLFPNKKIVNIQLESPDTKRAHDLTAET